MIKTGFQIIAGLPIEEQRKVKVYGRPDEKFVWLGATLIYLTRLYRYNGKEWEETQDE